METVVVSEVQKGAKKKKQIVREKIGSCYSHLCTVMCATLRVFGGWKSTLTLVPLSYWLTGCLASQIWPLPDVTTTRLMQTLEWSDEHTVISCPHTSQLHNRTIVVDPSGDAHTLGKKGQKINSDCKASCFGALAPLWCGMRGDSWKAMLSHSHASQNNWQTQHLPIPLPSRPVWDDDTTQRGVLMQMS